MKLKSLFQSNLFRNSYLLMAAQLLASVTGFVFWGLVARLILSDEVGIGSTLITAAMFLATLSKLGFDFGLIKHLPYAEKPSDLLNFAVVTVTGSAITLSVFFLIGLPLWSPALLAFFTTFQHVIVFIALTTSMGVALLINGILVAKRAMGLLIIKMIANGLLCIIFLIIFADRGASAILLAYLLAFTLDAIVSVGIVLPFIQQGYHLSLTSVKLPSRAFFKDSVGNLAAAQIQRLPDWLLPLMVLNLLGSSSAAYCYIAWTIGNGLSSLGAATGTSLFVEASHDPSSLNLYLRRALLFSLGLSLLIVIPGVIATHLILSLFGTEYVLQATPLLRLILVSIIPSTLLATYLGVIRAQSKIRVLISATGSITLIAIVLTQVLIPQWGLQAVGIAWLSAQIIVLLSVASTYLLQPAQYVYRFIKS